MIGAVILAVILLVVFPVAVAMSGALAAAGLGWALKSDADARYEGSELLELNR
ncbi:MAG TPA: hypothetical protein VK306_14350 [Acidimicrobiales bacterium]|nr:hypothetical protein [Acidimicrobiales bacterium]